MGTQRHSHGESWNRWALTKPATWVPTAWKKRTLWAEIHKTKLWCWLQEDWSRTAKTCHLPACI